MLQLRHVYKTYTSDRHVLRDLNFETDKSGLYLIKGESGSGKTTLFKLLTAMSKPTNGEIKFKKWPISALTPSQISEFRQSVGIVFQDFKLIPDMTIYDNISLPLKIQKKSKSEIDKLVLEIADTLSLRSYLNDYPEHISGGQQQKSAVARALITKPEFIVADEPTGNLDPQNSSETLNILSSCAKKGALVLIATHDQQLLSQYPDQVLTLDKGQLRS
jgi:cell division transport system ATP-binding protein